jgi:hypothetical protein
LRAWTAANLALTADALRGALSPELLNLAKHTLHESEDALRVDFASFAGIQADHVSHNAAP